MLVGTAITGALTRPATTLGSAPFHPGDDDDHARGVEALALAEQPVQPRHANVIQGVDTSLPISSAVRAASSATGRSDVPAA